MTQQSDTAYTKQARKALAVAHREEHDFGGWLAGILADVAGELGSASALAARRRPVHLDSADQIALLLEAAGDLDRG